MVQILGGDRRVADGEGVFAEVVERDRRLQLLELDREIGVLHLPGQHLGELGIATGRGVDRDVAVRVEERAEEGEALDMVPVGVPE